MTAATRGVVLSSDHLPARAVREEFEVAEAIQRRKIYQEVFDRLMERIRSGAIPPNAQLPSERELLE